MALQVVVTGGLGGGHHLRVQLFVAGDEGDIHQAAALFVYSACEHFGGIQEIVHDLGLVHVPLFHFLQAPDALEIFEHLAAAVDGPAVGGIVHGTVVRVGFVAHVNGRSGVQVLPDQILPDDCHHHTGGAHVLLHACVNQAVVADVAGPGEEHGALVADQHMALDVGQLVPGHAVDGLIFADVHIVGVFRNVQIAAIRHIAEISVLAGGGHMHAAILSGLSNGLFGPRAGLHVAGHTVFHQVHGDHGEL